MACYSFVHQHPFPARLRRGAGSRTGAPSADFDPGRVVPGIWQVMPTYAGDHMSLQGGIMKRNNIRPFYLELLELIDTLQAN